MPKLDIKIKCLRLTIQKFRPLEVNINHYVNDADCI